MKTNKNKNSQSPVPHSSVYSFNLSHMSHPSQTPPLLPKTLLCIDVSYLLFHRITALRTWHKHRTKEDATDDTLWSDEFKTKLIKRIDATLEQLCETHQPYLVLCGYDGHQNWRKQEYTDYKKGRKHDSGVLKLFQYGEQHIANNTLPILCPVHHVRHDALEADDFIHFTTRKCCADQPDTQVVIIANDHDYLPLLGNPDHVVRLFSLKAKNNELHLPINTITQKPMTGDEYLQYKILIGDKSDNIPSVFKRCGKKTAMKLITDPQKLHEQFDKGGEASQVAYDRNTRLIDNRCVPEELREWMDEHCKIG